ncbi:MAG: PAS domain-containing protein, partial [Tatlockia sp.]|nr:PAS domain-containing protein [Tatlockia sp.]
MIDVNGHYQSCNALQAKDFGLKSPDDIIGKTNFEIPSLKDHPFIIEIIENNNKKVFTDKEPQEFYEPNCNNDGSLTEYKSFKIPLFEDNQLIGLVGISFDLSQEAERIGNLIQKIDQTELTFNNIIDNLPEHIYWLDKENRFLGCNANQADDFGLTSSDEVKGLHVSAFQTKENAKTIIENNNKILNEGISLSAEESFLDRKGETHYYLSKKVPLRNNVNEIMGLIGISIDVSEQKKMEKELIRAKEKSEAANYIMTEFIANMGHDLATPISDVGSIAQMLSYYIDDYPEFKELFETLV